MSKRILTGLVCLAFLALTGSALSQQQQQKQLAPPPAPQAEKATTPEPDPRQILQKMCDFLKSQQQFTYKAEVADDHFWLPRAAASKGTRMVLDGLTFSR